MTDSGYSADHAAYYDAVVTSEDREDVEFYRERALAADGPVLELACGTGRITLPLLRAGVDVDGVDLSADALAVLREKAAEEDLNPTVWQADMTEFAVDRRYDLVICPFNALQHLLTVGDQLAALERVHEALAPGGEFVFDVFVPSFDVICERYGEWQTREREFRGGVHEVRTRSRLVDEVEQQFAAETKVIAPDGDAVVDEEHRLKMLPKREVELLARLSPFDDWRATGDFADEPISDGDSTQVWTLRT